MANTQEFSPIRVDEFGSSKPDDFDATVLDGYAVIRKSQKEKYGLYVERVLQIDGMDQPYIERDYLGFLSNQQQTRVNFAPSRDGKTFANGATEEDILSLVTGEGKLKPEEEIEYSGPYIIGTGKKLQPGNWSQFVETVKRLFPDPDHPEDVTKTTFAPLLDPKLQVRFDFARGHRFHFVRLPQDDKIKRGKNKDKEGGDTSGDFTVLCAQAYLGEVGVGTNTQAQSTSVKPATGAATSQPSQSSQPGAVASSNGDLKSRLEQMVLINLASRDDLPIKRHMVNGPVLKELPGNEMGPAMAILNDESWILSPDRPWKSDKGMLSLG